MKITPCWSVGNWIAAWFRCRHPYQLPRAWAISHQPRCRRRSINLLTSPIRAGRRAVLAQAGVPAQAAARAAVAEAVARMPASPEAALAREKVVLAAAAGAAPEKAPAAAAKDDN